MTIGEKIKLLRLERELSVEEFSNLINVSESVLIMIEQNKRKPTIQVLSKIAKAFNLSIQELLEDKKIENLSNNELVDLFQETVIRMNNYEQIVRQLNEEVKSLKEGILQRLQPDKISESIDLNTYKKCNICKQWFPNIEEYFTEDVCKKCHDKVIKQINKGKSKSKRQPKFCWVRE